MTTLPPPPPALPRVAVVVPTTDTGVELELPDLLDGRASLHVGRAELEQVSLAGLAAMESRLLEQAAGLATIRPDLLLLGCTSASFVRGRDGEQELVDHLREAAGAPVLTAARAMVAQLRRHGARVRLRASYTQDIVELEREYLQAHGLEVTSARGLGITEDEQTAAVTAAELAEFASEDDDADVVMLSCTNLRTAHAQPWLVQQLRRPVVSSNLALGARARAVLDLGADPHEERPS